jgi:hypothetical protein
VGGGSRLSQLEHACGALQNTDPINYCFCLNKQAFEGLHGIAPTRHKTGAVNDGPRPKFRRFVVGISNMATIATPAETGRIAIRRRRSLGFSQEEETQCGGSSKTTPG